MKAAAVGMFDGVHLGHQALVADVCAHAKVMGGTSAVFTFDTHPLSVVAPERSPQLLTTLPQRCEYLRKAGADEVVVLTFDHDLRRLTAEEFMRMLYTEHDVRLLVLGFNHRFGHDRLHSLEQYREVGQRVGMEVCRAEELVIDSCTGTVSSSTVRNAISEGDVDLANRMLGRNYSVRGCVVHGQQVGRTIGFPTANIEPEQRCQLLPKVGVYAAYLNGMPAMVNIGSRPTLGADLPLTIEANVIDYEGDLYGCGAEVQFVRRIRDERRFDTLDSLRAQLTLDRAAILASLK